jgi:glycosyltransferase involved in cell wall biosynthesis
MDNLISIIVPTFNKASQLEYTLELLCKQDLSIDQYEIVVVDNNSTDNTRALLDRFSLKCDNMRYVTEKQRGPAAARNRGIDESRGYLLIFLDDDMLIAADHVRQHKYFHDKMQQPLCVVGRWRDNTQYDCRVLALYYKNRLPIIPSGKAIINQGLSLASGNFSLYRSTLDLVREERNGEFHYYDPQLLTLEDSDLGYRLELAGVKFYYSQEIYSQHCHKYTRKQIKNRVYQAGYYQLLFNLKHPEVVALQKIIIIKNKFLNMLLLFSGLIFFSLGYLFQKISPWFMLKGVGACLLFEISKGYQKAVQEFTNNNR